MDVAFDEDGELRYAGTPNAGGGGTSPIDAGSGSGEEGLHSAAGVGQQGVNGNKPAATNNFVTKLYQ